MSGGLLPAARPPSSLGNAVLVSDDQSRFALKDRWSPTPLRDARAKRPIALDGGDTILRLDGLAAVPKKPVTQRDGVGQLVGTDVVLVHQVHRSGLRPVEPEVAP